MSGSSITVPKTAIMNTPPTLWTHLPTDKPRIEVTTITASSAADASATKPPLAVIQPALGPMAYDKYVVPTRPISEVNTMTYSQRFHASMKPTVWLNPSLAH